MEFKSYLASMSKAAEDEDEAKVLQLATKCIYEASRWVTERQNRRQVLKSADMLDGKKRRVENDNNNDGEQLLVNNLFAYCYVSKSS